MLRLLCVSIINIILSNDEDDADVDGDVDRMNRNTVLDRVSSNGETTSNAVRISRT